ncbi:hypothetical protein [Alkaliphilus sp. B6464]|uniref:hypothetical protein n=1 Tax=Alkaliphilus sp. B6464 TaxID=2731219 RepID=UPI001BA8973F|nr:hypothetical protein [Alkaliphilus sp. B6464]QUH21919.1 hypothetical protein HYG84_18460 [Alkaliphilus sp. B6464]
MNIEYVPMSPCYKYKIVTLKEVKENLKGWYGTLVVPEGVTEETRGILIGKGSCLSFNVIEE